VDTNTERVDEQLVSAKKGGKEEESNPFNNAMITKKLQRKGQPNLSETSLQKRH
jgi:hypothetical protein